MADPQRPRKSPLLPVLVAVAAAIALVAMLVGGVAGGHEEDAGSRTTRATPAASASPGEGGSEGADAAPWARREAGDPMAKGDVAAPVVLIAYSDFQCPFCGKYARDTAPVLEKKYVDDGTLRIEWRDFPYLGPESMTAALAARAAAAQGRFWEFHDALYADQPPPNSGKVDQGYLEAIAKRVGLDLERFRSDMTSAATKKQVQRDFREGQSIGVTGTPSFLINGTPVVGAQPIEVFEKAIEEAAAG